MKKDDKNLLNNDEKNENKSESVNTNDLLFLHFNLVKNNSYHTYISFLKQHALDDFSKFLDKLFNKKGDINNEKNDIKSN